MNQRVQLAIFGTACAQRLPPRQRRLPLDVVDHNAVDSQSQSQSTVRPGRADSKSACPVCVGSIITGSSPVVCAKGYGSEWSENNVPAATPAAGTTWFAPVRSADARHRRTSGGMGREVRERRPMLALAQCSRHLAATFEPAQNEGHIPASSRCSRPPCASARARAFANVSEWCGPTWARTFVHQCTTASARGCVQQECACAGPRKCARESVFQSKGVHEFARQLCVRS